MSLTAAAVFLLALPGVLGKNGWGVEYTAPNLAYCGLKGSAVNMSCTYKHPPEYTVAQRFWMPLGDEGTITNTKYIGRVKYICDNSSNFCSVIITDLKKDDEKAKYNFRFTTTPTNAWSGNQVSLTVTNLTVSIKRDDNNKRADVECQTFCQLPNNPTFIWYKNGEEIEETQSPQANIPYDVGDSLVCAVRGHEDIHSPSACVTGGPCNQVGYKQRNICAFKGSSVDISCTYNSSDSVVSKFWFSPQFGNPLKPEDLKEDPQFKGRVQLLDSEGGQSTLRITQLRESDAAEYRFKFTTQNSEWKNDFPGTTVTVTDVQMLVASADIGSSQTKAELKCVSSCSPTGPISFVWVKNGQNTQGEKFSGWFSPGDEIYCALAGHEDYRSPTLYAPVVPSVTPEVAPGEIIEGISVNLTCAGNGATVNISWYKKDGNADIRAVGGEPQLIFKSIESSDSGEYYCTAESQLGNKSSNPIKLDVQYPPRLPSVSVTPTGDIVEGSSVNLTCISDANPAPNYSWYKGRQKLPQENLTSYHFISIRAEDKEIYYCKAENHLGWSNSSHLIDVLYPPRVPSILMVPTGDIVEGMEVYMTCDSHANPAANYSWYKEDHKLLGTERFFRFLSIRAGDKGTYHCESENSLGVNSFHVVVDVQYPPRPPSVSTLPSGDITVGSTVALNCSSDANPDASYNWYKGEERLQTASGPTFIIPSFAAADSGHYYCEATNSRGSKKVHIHLQVSLGTSQYLGLIVVPLVIVLLIAVLVWWSLHKRAKKDNMQASEYPEKPERNSSQKPEQEVAEQEDIHYASVNFIKTSADPLYTNMASLEPKKRLQEEDDSVEYSSIRFSSSAPRNMGLETVEDPSALYSTVNKTSAGPRNDR